ncbi:MAG: nucleotidyltransferase family protein [Endomicrobiia bacterium]
MKLEKSFLEKISNIIRNNKEILIRDYKVKSIGLFGSCVRKEQTKKSDIDILVEFSEPVGLKFFALENYLSKILRKKVDLVTKKAIKPVIKKEILKEVIKI